jgi:hypothetical protein
VSGSCAYGDEPAGSGATELGLISKSKNYNQSISVTL